MSITVFTASGLGILTLVCLFHISQYLKNWIYPSAQTPCIPILLFTVIMGWGNWSIMMVLQYHFVIEYTLNILKGLILLSFYFYITRLLGWERIDNKYEKEKVIPALCSLGRNPGCCKSCEFVSIDTLERTEKFLRIVRISMTQYISVILLIFVIGVYIDLFQDVSEQFAPVSRILRAVSSFAALLTVVGLIVFASRNPDLKGFGMGIKLIWIKLIIFIAEIQPIILMASEKVGVIQFEDPEFITYLSSVLVCFEMLILGLVQFFVFPISDFISNYQKWVELIENSNKDQNNNELNRLEINK